MSYPSEPNDRRNVLGRALQVVEEMQAKLDALQREKREPIAIVGMGCRFPGHANSPEAYWSLLRDGVDAIREVPSDRWDIAAYYDADPDSPGKMYTRQGGFLDQVDRFDAQFFGISPREALKTDPQHRLLLEVSWEALEHAGIAPTSLAGSQTGVFIGITNNDYARIVERAGLEFIDAYHLTGNCLNFAAGRIAYFLGLHGPAMAVDTACSSSGVTVHLACQSLRNRECNLALAGGVNLILSPEISITSTKARTLSPDGYCKTFDSRANGYVRGEGCGVVVLKRLSDALADGDAICAVIRGSAVSQDGATSGITVPNKLAQIEVMRQALERAGLEPNQVDYVEAHGTGTPLGDPIEIRALASVYSQGRSRNHPLIIGTAKTNVGHLESAAGVAGLIKVVLSLQNGVIPPHLHFNHLNPAITLDDIPALIPLQRMPWPRRDGVRTAGLSFFGGSGTIAHMLVEEAPEVGPAPDGSVRTSQLLCLSAQDPAALDELADRYQGFVTASRASLADVCYTTDAGRAHFNHRLAVVASTSEDLQERLLAFRSGNESAGLWSGVPGPQRPKVVFLFTGQGGQYVNMGRRLYEGEPVFRGIIDRCDELLRPHLPRSLRSVLYPGPEEDTPLDETQYTHVAMFAVQYGLAELWRSWGVEPSLIVGHSVGEVVAATVAGQMSFEDGLTLMRERGRLMQSLPAAGMMASLLAGEERVSAALAPYRDRVAIAAVNGPESTVISGEREAVQAILRQLESEGAKVKVLKVSNAFHSPLVEPVLAEFERIAGGLRYTPPQVNLFSTMRVEMTGKDHPLDAAYWRQNLRNTVRFSESMRKLYEQGYRLFLEIGPSPILVNMGSQCVPIGEGVWLPSMRQDRDDWQQLLDSLGQLYVNGVDVNWNGFYQDRRARKLHLPTYCFQRERYWVDSPSSATRATTGARQLDGTGHPLLGARLRSAVPLFEQQLSTTSLPFLGDHRVFDKAVLPATAYLEIATAAASEVLAVPQASVSNMVLTQPLVLPDSEERTIQVTVTETEPGSGVFKIFSLRPQAEKGNPVWILHATGDISSGDRARAAPPARSTLPGIQGRCTKKVEVESFYESLRARGLDFGSDFKGLEGLWRQDGEAIGLIMPPASLATETERYHMHPAVLDACLQVVVAALPAPDASTMETQGYLPQRVEKFRVHQRPGDRLWSHVTLRAGTGIDCEFTADVEVLDPSGQLVAEVRGLVLRRAGREAVIPIEQEDFSEWLYTLQWEKASRPVESGVSSPASMPSPRQIAEALLPYSRSNGSERGLQEFAALLPRIEAVSTQYVCEALRELGWRIEEHQTFTTESQARELRVPRRYHRLMGRMLEMLQQDGYLFKESLHWKVSRVPPAFDPDAELSILLQEYPACSGELILVGRCGRHFARAIRGESQPLELLFPDGSLKDMERLYRDSPYFRFYNGLIEAAVSQVAGGVPSDRRLRILEIGGGTGSATASILRNLPQRTEYVFTDVSSLFVSNARETFSAHSFVDYRVLDIDKDPLGQGFGSHLFDVIIASNVLHATADLRRTLQHVQSLLASEGLLVMLEATQPLRFTDIIVGLTDGWWGFTDTELRPSHALLSEGKWKALLTAMGFTEVAISPEQDRESVLSSQSLILARGPRTLDAREATRAVDAPQAVDAPERASWLILGDNGGVGQGLETALLSRGEGCLFASAGKKFKQPGPRHFEIDGSRLEDFQKLLEAAGGTNSAPLKGVVYLWPLNSCHSSFAGWEPLKEEIQGACESLLHLVKAIVSGRSPRTHNLWIVTRGAQAAESEIAFASLSQFPAAALGSTIGLEYPELHCVRVDLDPVVSPNEIEALFQELGSENSNDEDMVAFRRGSRLVARLGQNEASLSQGRKNLTQPYQLRISSPGILENLALSPVDRRPPEPGEAEIEVHSTGLGFRDVLMALGRYPGPGDLFGYECAGRVVRLGEGVDRFHVGQRVMAVGPGSFSSFTTLSADRIIPIPESLRYAEAAGLPSAFLTAQYALCRLDRISGGERVLIHAAAGGVGLAAVQLAQRAGAEIFATAGSPEKRAYLKSLGVPHVMDSRSLDFAAGIMEITGGRGVDLVLNSLSGEFIPKSLAVTAAGGRFLEIGRTGIWDEAQVAEMNGSISYFRINLAESFDRNPELIRSLFEELLPDFRKGLLTPLPCTVFPADEAVSAFRFMAQARQIGKVVVSHPSFSDRPIGSFQTEPEKMLKADGSYLVTGGLAGLGLLAAGWMSERGAGHIVLTGRSAVSESAADAIRQMEKRGARVLVARGDVSDQAQLAELFSKFGHSLPPLRGIIHSAGTLDDGVLAQQTWERFRKVMAPKVDGAWHLHTLSKDQPIDFFVLFSSAVSMLGSAGQGNHVAACAFEDALAHYRHDLGLPALSLNWGPWGEIGAATPGMVSRRLRMKGFHPMEPQQGLRVLEHLLWKDGTQVGVMSVDWRQYVESLPPGRKSMLFSRVTSKAAVHQPGEPRVRPRPAALLEQLSQAPSNRRRPLIEAHIREQAIRVLGLSPSFKLDPNRGLATFGMDSLMTIELKNRLQVSVGKPLSSTIVFDHPTVTALAEYLEQNVLPAPGPKEAAGKPGGTDEEGRTITELNQLSDEEAEAMLAEELSGSA
jgi:acyl transferase domain-containing protein/NADPH:quinone reductase-like Zn-dependent oxidoreductase/NAD(P)-dependent dehydrogenase (short-subunit alcohol dehydrogenase family)/ubiquinone/menaquinone biosynthesis C-methylase UbiE